MDDLINQAHYVVTASTGVVHSVPCIRNADRKPLRWWPYFAYDTDRACSHCLPDGLPSTA